MKFEHIKILCDPYTKSELKLLDPIIVNGKVVSGKLVSDTSTYEIINGIPRFIVSDGYSSNFAFQWKKWSRVQFESHNTNKPMAFHTKNMFKTICDTETISLSDKLVLDIGCGSGRFTDVALSLGAEVIAIDYSSAVDAAKNNFNESQRVSFIQCDALNLPFKDSSFDFAFSIGVLHHTPAPEKGVSEAYRVIKYDSHFAISVYGKTGYYTLPNVQFWRHVFKFMWPLFRHYPPLIYSYLFGTLQFLVASIWPPLRLPLWIFFPIMYLPDLKWTILDTFDSVTPSYQSGHESHEIFTWFRNCGFRNIYPGAWRYTNYLGKK